MRHNQRMFRKVTQCVVALILFGLCPGGLVIIEDAGHLLATGHLIDGAEHDSADEGSTGCGDCNDCSDCTHCHCNAPPCLRPTAQSYASYQPLRETQLTARYEGGPSYGVRSEIDRPPRA